MNDATRDPAIPLSPGLENTITAENDVSSLEKPRLSGRVLLLSLQATFNAVVIGVIAKALVLLINLITNISFYKQFSFQPASPAGNHWGWMVILVPVAGSIIVGIMARFGSAAIRGHGIPEAMENIITNESKISPIITFLKPISSAISIGTGGPFGAEGPIIATGGAFGSLTGQVMRISAGERKIMLAAGACAGMAAIFGSPLAAVLLAIELLLFEFSPRSIIPVALSCAAGAIMHLFLFGSEPVFAMPEIPVATVAALGVYALFGAIIGVVASFISKSVYWVEDMFEKLPVHWMWWPAIGAVVVGVTGYFAPNTMGVGYDNITGLLTGKLPVAMLLVLFFLKYLSWVVALGSGTSGGTLAPLFTIGGAFGGLLAIALLAFVPSLEINIATAVLIGMAAMFAGASRAVLTSIIFAFETTAQPHGLLPLLVACMAAYFVSFFLLKESIMTEKIKRRGIRTPDVYAPDVLQNITAETIMQNAPVIANENFTVTQVRELRSKQKTDDDSRFSILVDNNGILTGFIENEALESETISGTTPVKNIMILQSAMVPEDQPLSVICGKMSNGETEVIAVSSKNDKNKIVGVVEALDILKAYSNMHSRNNHYHTSISLRRRARRLMIKGRTYIQSKKNAESL